MQLKTHKHVERPRSAEQTEGGELWEELTDVWRRADKRATRVARNCIQISVYVVIAVRTTQRESAGEGFVEVHVLRKF